VRTLVITSNKIWPLQYDPEKRVACNGKLLISETKKAKMSTLEESSWLNMYTQIRRTSRSTFKF